MMIELKKYIGPILFIVLSIVIFTEWQLLDSKSKELEQYKRSANIQQEIQTMEAKLEGLKLREKEYLDFEVQKANLGKSLDILVKRTNELNKQKKERIQKDVEKLSTTDLSNAFNAIGFPNTITSK